MHLYGEAARCVPEISNPRVVEGARQVHLYGGAASGACSRRGLGCTFVARASGCTYMAEPLPCAMV